jgi:NAD(P)-dependent dehydrogenase (short-subunit alcohol dehydrogenase family)
VDEFDGRTAVVTGAASGIGYGLAARFAAAGMNLVMADVEGDQLDAAGERLREVGAPVLTVTTDVSDGEQVDHLAAEAVAAFGAVHVLCNNAGVGVKDPIAKMTTDAWSWVLGVNLWGVIHGLRAFLPGMLAHGEPGHVVNTSSMAALLNGPGMAGYCSSKAAVVSITEVLAQEMEEAGGTIGVSVLCPGVVNTRIHQAGRNRPGRDPATVYDPASRSGEIHSGARIQDPSETAECVFDAIVAGRLYVFSHPEWIDMVTPRFDRIVDAAAAHAASLSSSSEGSEK